MHCLNSCILSVHVVQVVWVKDGNHKVSILCISTILKLFSLGLLQAFDMFLSLRVDLSQFFLLLFALIAVFFLYIAASILDLLWNLFICAEFLVNFLLGLVSLRNEHFPSSYIVHSLIFMSEEVSFHERTILHCDLLSLTLDCTFSLNVSKWDLYLTIVLFIFAMASRSPYSALTGGFIGISPTWEFGGLDNYTSEKFAEYIKKFTFFLTCLNHVPILRESRLQAMVDCLWKVVVEGREEFLFSHLADSWIFNESVGDVVGCHSVEQELVMC